jgi:hypothetical protein
MKTESDEIISRVTSKNRVPYTAGQTYTHPGGNIFFVYVPVAGSVTYTTEGGQTNTESLGVGYHPSSFIKIHSTTAINLTIIF